MEFTKLKMAKTTFSQIDEYGFERSETFDYKTYESFMSEYLTVLAKRSKRWDDLKGVDKYKKTSTLKRFVRKGIPINERAAVWMSISGGLNLQQESNFKYQELQNQINNNTIIDMIEIDLPRTFPDNVFFTKENVLPRQLFRVLATFAHQNSDVGYCQGLNYIAGLLLLATKNEEATFWLLKALVEKILPPYYIKSMSGLITDLAVLDEIIKDKEPAIHNHITNIGMPWAVTTTKWFICIFSEVLPTETVLRIWDSLFYEGSKIIFRVALTLIRLHRDEILACRELGEIVTCFKNMAFSPGVVNCHQFSANMFKIPGRLTNKYVQKLRRKHAHAAAN